MKTLYLLFKRYKGMAFAEITMAVLIALLSVSFSYSLSYSFEAFANSRYVDRVFGDDVALFYYYDDVVYPSANDEEYLDIMFQFLDIYDSESMQNAAAEIATTTNAQGVSRVTQLPVIIEKWAENPKRELAWAQYKEEYSNRRTLISYDPLTLKYLPIDLREGRWFTQEEACGIQWNDETDEIPVILSMDWDECYEIGDTFYATIDDYDLEANSGRDYTIPTDRMKFKVIGKLADGTYYYRMQNSYDQFIGIFGNSELSVDETTAFLIAPELIINGKRSSTQIWASIQQDVSFVFADDANNLIDTWNTSDTKNYGEFVSVKEIAEKTKDEFQSGSKTYTLHSIIFGIMLLLNLYGYNLMLIRKQKNTYAVYFASGMSWNKGLLMCLLGNLLVFVFAGILGSVGGVALVNSVREMSADTNILAVLTSFGAMIIIFLISSVFTTRYMVKTDPSELLSKE